MKARTLFLGIDADEKLWLDAVITATCLHSLMKVAKNRKAPYEMFMVFFVSGVSHLRTWGWHVCGLCVNSWCPI